MSSGLAQRGSWAGPWRVAACLLCAMMLWLAAPSGHAQSAMYRCTGSLGEAVYSNKPAGYQNCTRLGSMPDAAPVHKARPVMAPASAPASSLAGVQGSADTDAKTVLPSSLGDHPSLAWVEGSVATSAKVLEPASTAVPPPQNGSDASVTDAAPPTQAPASSPGDRVLRGAVYRVTRADGSVEYTNLPPATQKGHAVTMLFTYIDTCVACNLHSTIRWDSVALHLQDYAEVIQLASRESGVEESFLRAIIHAESAFNPRAMSLKGAQGLMQLMPATAQDMGVRDAFDSAENIRGGARYLALLLRTFHGNEQLAAAAYNAGPGAVQRYNGVPPYAETQVYVERVGTLRRRYGEALHVVATRAPVVAGLSTLQ